MRVTATDKVARAGTCRHIEWFWQEALGWVGRGAHSDRCGGLAVAKASIASHDSKAVGLVGQEGGAHRRPIQVSCSQIDRFLSKTTGADAVPCAELAGVDVRRLAGWTLATRPPGLS